MIDSQINLWFFIGLGIGGMVVLFGDYIAEKWYTRLKGGKYGG